MLLTLLVLLVLLMLRILLILLILMILLVLLALLVENNCAKKWKRRDWACGIFATTFERGGKHMWRYPCKN